MRGVFQHAAARIADDCVAPIEHPKGAQLSELPCRKLKTCPSAFRSRPNRSLEISSQPVQSGRELCKHGTDVVREAAVHFLPAAP